MLQPEREAERERGKEREFIVELLTRIRLIKTTRMRDKKRKRMDNIFNIRKNSTKVSIDGSSKLRVTSAGNRAHMYSKK